MANYEICCDPAKIPFETVYPALSAAYACEAPAPEAWSRAIPNSLHFAAFSADGELAGYVRVVTDRATFALLADAFVVEGHRGLGVSGQLIGAVASHAELEMVPVFASATQARGFYVSSGFEFAASPLMQLVRR